MVLAAQLGSPVAAEQPSTEQLNAIAGYLEAYPELAEGDTPLAALLRRFLVETLAGNDYFRFRPDLSDALNSEPGGEAGVPSSPEPAY